MTTQTMSAVAAEVRDRMRSRLEEVTAAIETADAEVGELALAAELPDAPDEVRKAFSAALRKSAKLQEERARLSLTVEAAERRMARELTAEETERRRVLLADYLELRCQIEEIETQLRRELYGFADRIAAGNALGAEAARLARQLGLPSPRSNVRRHAGPNRWALMELLRGLLNGNPRQIKAAEAQFAPSGYYMKAVEALQAELEG